jgi:tetratricopeptide (TPR) repeat protein
VAGSTYVDYSQPLMPAQTAETSASGDDSSAAEGEPPSPAGLESFNAARAAFQQGDYSQALSLVNKTLATMPDDPVVHEFRSLVLFALQKYQDSAAAIYAVLAAGPGWDWTTLSSLYPSIDVYTTQLRSLESYCKSHPDAADSSFLLAYHYLTCGYTDAAVGQLQKVVRLQPQNRVAKELLQMAGGAAPAEGPAPTPGDGVDEPAARNVPRIAMSQLAGQWSATGADKTRFDLQLSEKGEFTWTYTAVGQKPESVRGVYAIDGDSLAMQPDTGGTLLAKITPPADGRFHFALVGGAEVDPGLDFRKK